MLDARIPLMGVQPRPPQNPLTLMKDVMGAREEMAQLQDAARQRQELEEIRKIYQEVGIDPAKDTERIGRIAQVNPVLAEKLRVEQSKMRSGEAQAARDQAEAVGQMMETAAKWAEPIVMWMDDPKRWKEGLGMLSFLAQVAEQGGVKGAGQLVSSVSQEYSPEAYAQLRKSAQMLSQIGTLRKTPGALDKARMLLDQYRRERGEPDYDGLTRIFRDAAGQTSADRKLGYQRLEALVDGKPTMVVFDPQSGQYLDPSSMQPVKAAPIPPAELGDRSAYYSVGTPRQMEDGTWAQAFVDRNSNPPRVVEVPFSAGTRPKPTEGGLTKENNALSGLATVRQMDEILASPDANNIILKSAVPGSPFARRYTALGMELGDLLARLRTGAQINEYEMQTYMQDFLPKAADIILDDPEETRKIINFKIGKFRGLFSRLARAGGLSEAQVQKEVDKLYGEMTRTPGQAAQASSASTSDGSGRVRVRAPNGQEAWLSPADAKKAIAAGATEVK